MAIDINLDAILGELKSFQRKTVDYVFQRMYEDADPTHRFLVADEVGLGKTKIARGVVAKAIQHLQHEGVERIDVIYICSNLEIAQQNIRRLNVTGDTAYSRASRITLLPLDTNLVDNRLNFISLTPSTSLDMSTSNMGVANERALIFALIQQLWDGDTTEKIAVKVLSGQMGWENFKRYVEDVRQKVLTPEFIMRFANELQQYPTLRNDWIALCDTFRYSRETTKHDKNTKIDRGLFIRTMRQLLAFTCIDMLEPDLIIMDEFQRFRQLLNIDDGNNENELVQQLFNYADKHVETQARVLLLSATPYKMYTTDLDGEDDHYGDFLQTYAFLQPDKHEQERLKADLKRYRADFQQFVQGDVRVRDLLTETKQRIEDRLKQVMVRTERLSATANRNGMLRNMPLPAAQFNVSDFENYIALQNVAQHLDEPGILHYWKSGAYLLNFMQDYKLKIRLNEMLQNPVDTAVLGEAVQKAKHFLLDKQVIARYDQIDPGNVHLRYLLREMLGEHEDEGTWQLLWIPPSLPYYQLGAPFKGQERLTKRLIFSNWRLVPRVIASLTSYELERRAMMKYYGEASAVPERHSPLLNFPKDGEFDIHNNSQPAGMSAITLLYPSVTMAQLGDPLTVVQNASQTIDEVKQLVSDRIQAQLNRFSLSERYESDSPFLRAAWYWITPILLDLLNHDTAESTRSWLETPNLAQEWSNADEEEKETGWTLHVGYLKRFVSGVLAGEIKLGQRPDDLLEVLTQIALASPAVIALRTLARRDVDLQSPQRRLTAARMGWTMRNFFNRREQTVILRGLAEGEYWRRVLAYSVDGCLQAVFDEYAHVLWDALALHTQSPSHADEMLQHHIEGVLGLRTVSLSIDDLTVEDGQLKKQDKTWRMSAHYAMSLLDQVDSSVNSQRSHTALLRDAFNSPFYPFVLASTSIGQEGLDFHLYCHAIIHWNLPHNPVDLEQREGRIHRYKGHAVRKNLAIDHGQPTLAKGESDVWSAMFEAGTRQNGHSTDIQDLIPFWIYPLHGNHEGFQIERYVPLIPLSADQQHFDYLQEALVYYRMIFGQPRQDDLMHAILNKPELQEQLKGLDLRINLQP